MHQDYRIGALTIHMESDHPIVGSAIADQFLCREHGRLLCVNRVVDTLCVSRGAKKYTARMVWTFFVPAKGWKWCGTRVFPRYTPI